MNEFLYGKIVKSTCGLLWIALLSMIVFTACKEQPQGIQPNDAGQNQSPVITAAPTASPSPTPEPSYTQQATLVAVGDVMMHSPQIPAGYDKATQTYNYDAFFSEVKAILSLGDWAVANLETPLAGKEAGYSGYPQFNAPAELADALKNAGFNIITTANNHSLDRREPGVIKTLEHLHAKGLIPVGTAISPTDADKITIVTKNEISMAIMAYTYGTNGIPIPEGKDYLVSLIDEEKMIRDIARAREQGVDLVTIALHFGLEYQRQPNEQQKQLVDHLIQAGADIILGSHPHVVQPYQFIDTMGNDGLMKRGLVIYSMGNFISNQTSGFKDYGVIFKVQITKQFPEKTIEIGMVEAIPTWVHIYYSEGKRSYRVLPLEAVVASRNDRILTKNDYERLEQGLNEMKRHLESLAIPVDKVTN